MWVENLDIGSNDPILDNQITKIDAVSMDNIPWRDQLTKESSEQLNSLETQLTWANLRELWVSRSSAFEMAKEFFHISDPLNFDVFKKQVEDFQRKNWLEVDWKIWKRTYMEMYVQRLIPIVDGVTQLKDINNKIDSKTLEYIKFANSHPFASENTQLLLSEKLAEYQTISWWRDLNFDSAMKSSTADWLKSMNTDQRTQEVLNQKSENWNTLYEDIRDKWFKEGLSRHSWEVKLVALVAFIFWAFYKLPWMEKIPGMWTWYWRITWLIWWSYLWGWALLEDILKKWADIAWKGYDNAKAWIEKWKENFEKGKYFENLVKESWDVSWNLSTELWKSYDAFVGSLNIENFQNKNTDKYVKDFDFVSKTLNNDSGLMNLKITELRGLQWKLEWIKWIISNRDEFFPASLKDDEKKQREQGLLNYVNLLLSKEVKPGYVYVKDLVYSKSVMDGFLDNLSKNNKWYTKNTKADNLIKQTIWNINDKVTQREVIKIISNQYDIEEWNDKDNYDKLEKYLKENKILKSNDIALIESILSVFKSEMIFHETVAKINLIKLADWTTTMDNIESINNKVAQLEDYKNSLDNNTEILATIIDKPLIEKAYNDKKLELYKKWSEIEWWTWKYSDEFNNQKKEHDKETVKSLILSLDKVPNKDSKPNDFEIFFNSNIENNKNIKELKDKYSWPYSVDTIEYDIYNKIDSYISKYEKVLKDYEKVKLAYVKKVDDIKTKINAIVIPASINTIELESKKTELQGFIKEFELLKSDIIVSHNYIDDVALLWNKYVKWEIVIQGSDNLFERIDRKVASTTNRPNLESLSAEFKTIVIDIESKYWINIDVTNIDINNTDSVSTAVSSILEQNTNLSTIDNNLKSSKLTQLKNKSEELARKYRDAIKAENDLTNIAKLKTNYDNLVWNKLWDLISSDTKNTIEKEYKLQKFRLEVKLNYSLKISDIANEEIKEICMDFIDNYENSFVKDIEIEASKQAARVFFNKDLTLEKFVTNLWRIKWKDKLWTNEIPKWLKDNINDTLDKLKG